MLSFLFCSLQLSHYLDVVEVQIAQQISRRSEAFFHAITSHDELQEKMKSTCRNIKYLRYHFSLSLHRGSKYLLNKLKKRNKMQGLLSILSLFFSTGIIWALTQENLSTAVCKQQRRRPACASVQTVQRLCYSLMKKYSI